MCNQCVPTQTMFKTETLGPSHSVFSLLHPQDLKKSIDFFPRRRVRGPCPSHAIRRNPKNGDDLVTWCTGYKRSILWQSNIAIEKIKKKKRVKR